MIAHHIPNPEEDYEPRYLSELDDDEVEALQLEFECKLSDETLCEIYRRLGL